MKKEKRREPLRDLGLLFEKLAREGYTALYQGVMRMDTFFLRTSSGQGVMRRVLRADNPREELALELTIVVTGANSQVIDKPDGNLERMAFEWYAENEMLIAETILSGEVE